MRLSLLRHGLASCLALGLAASCVIDWDKLEPNNAEGGSAGGNSGVGGGGTACTPGEAAPCYTGDSSTENVGQCVGGTTRCIEDGSQFGACDDEVTPAAAEDCNTPGDDNCNGEVNETSAGCTCTPGVLVACYEGPAGTEDVGACTAGLRLCQPDGLSETICFGQVVPRVEECGTAADDDCDGTPNVGCPTWAKRFGAAGNDFTWDITVLPDGNIFLAGQYDSAIDFGGGALVDGAGNDAYIAQLAPNGDFVFSASFGGAGNEWIDEVAVDAAGNIYMVGTFDTEIVLGGTPGTLAVVGTENAFIAKLDTNQVVEWAVRLGETGITRGLAIASDAAGNTVATGYYNGSIDFGGGAIASQDDDIWMVRIDPAGAIVSSITVGNLGTDRAFDVLLDGTDVILVGEYDEPIDFGDGLLPDAVGQDGFIVRLDNLNQGVWTRRVGDAGNQHVYYAALSGSDIVVLGDVASTFDFDNTVSQAIDDDIFVIKLNSAGVTTFANFYPGAQDQHAGGLGVSDTGNIWFGVSHELTTDYGGGVVQSLGSDDWAIILLDPMGTNLRSHRFGDSDDQDPRGIGVDALGNVVVAGDCQATMVFGVDSALILSGSTTTEDICVAKMPP
jgi:hypothetical protein